ncbi:MAG TPA: hypothetical protein VHV54_13545, partial [Candidatus Binatia bacterium]|nr:hypothetical protein [Candidatus Binatia bacterium]
MLLTTNFKVALKVESTISHLVISLGTQGYCFVRIRVVSWILIRRQTRHPIHELTRIDTKIKMTNEKCSALPKILDDLSRCIRAGSTSYASARVRSGSAQVEADLRRAVGRGPRDTAQEEQTVERHCAVE